MEEKSEVVKTKSNEHNVEVIEKGVIYFFYRPKVEKEEAHNLDDVQRLYIVLRPDTDTDSVEESDSKLLQKKQESDTEESSKLGRLLRLIIMGKKSLPDPSKNRGRPYWGFVDLVTTKIEDVKVALKGEEYDTKTQGHRHVEPARALAEGVYGILRHTPSRKGMHTHLIYKLEFPPESEKNEVQESLNVEREGSFIIQIKNPDDHQGGRSSGFQSKKRRASIPAKMKGQFGNRKYVAADPPDVLNYEGCEFLLIAASDDIDQELGLEIQTEVEDSKDPSCSDLVRTFGETVPTRPLLEGTWE